MPCDSSESHAAHIDLHRLFTARQTLNISASGKKVARGGEKDMRKEMVKSEVKGRWDKLLDVHKLRREEEKRKRGGKPEGCCKRAHVLPGDVHPKEIPWSLLCLRVCVWARLSTVGGVSVNYRTAYLRWLPTDSYRDGEHAYSSELFCSAYFYIS